MYTNTGLLWCLKAVNTTDYCRVWGTLNGKNTSTNEVLLGMLHSQWCTENITSIYRYIIMKASYFFRYVHVFPHEVLFKSFGNVVHADITWPLMSTKDNRLLAHIVVHLPSKCEISPRVPSTDVIIVSFLYLMWHILIPKKSSVQMFLLKIFWPCRPQVTFDLHNPQ